MCKYLGLKVYLLNVYKYINHSFFISGNISVPTKR